MVMTSIKSALLWYSCISNLMYYTYRFYSIVHGNWSAWGAWSSCSETCGSGILTRYRSCSNPAPANGGSNCQGNNDETTSCLTTPCQGIYYN
jgi:hypothetical protein